MEMGRLLVCSVQARSAGVLAAATALATTTRATTCPTAALPPARPGRTGIPGATRAAPAARTGLDPTPRRPGTRRYAAPWTRSRALRPGTTAWRGPSRSTAGSARPRAFTGAAPEAPSAGTSCSAVRRPTDRRSAGWPNLAPPKIRHPPNHGRPRCAPRKLRGPQLLAVCTMALGACSWRPPPLAGARAICHARGAGSWRTL